MQSDNSVIHEQAENFQKQPMNYVSSCPNQPPIEPPTKQKHEGINTPVMIPRNAASTSPPEQASPRSPIAFKKHVASCQNQGKPGSVSQKDEMSKNSSVSPHQPLQNKSVTASQQELPTIVSLNPSTIATTSEQVQASRQEEAVIELAATQVIPQKPGSEFATVPTSKSQVTAPQNHATTSVTPSEVILCSAKALSDELRIENTPGTASDELMEKYPRLSSASSEPSLSRVKRQTKEKAVFSEAVGLPVANTFSQVGTLKLSGAESFLTPGERMKSLSGLIREKRLSPAIAGQPLKGSAKEIRDNFGGERSDDIVRAKVKEQNDQNTNCPRSIVEVLEDEISKESSPRTQEKSSSSSSDVPKPGISTMEFLKLPVDEEEEERPDPDQSSHRQEEKSGVPIVVIDLTKEPLEGEENSRMTEAQPVKLEVSPAGSPPVVSVGEGALVSPLTLIENGLRHLSEADGARLFDSILFPSSDANDGGNLRCTMMTLRRYLTLLSEEMGRENDILLLEKLRLSMLEEEIMVLRESLGRRQAHVDHLSEIMQHRRRQLSKVHALVVNRSHRAEGPSIVLPVKPGLPEAHSDLDEEAIALAETYLEARARTEALDYPVRSEAQRVSLHDAKELEIVSSNGGQNPVQNQEQERTTVLGNNGALTVKVTVSSAGPDLREILSGIPSKSPASPVFMIERSPTTPTHPVESASSVPSRSPFPLTPSAPEAPTSSAGLGLAPLPHIPIPYPRRRVQDKPYREGGVPPPQLRSSFPLPRHQRPSHYRLDRRTRPTVTPAPRLAKFPPPPRFPAPSVRPPPETEEQLAFVLEDSLAPPQDAKRSSFQEFASYVSPLQDFDGAVRLERLRAHVPRLCLKLRSKYPQLCSEEIHYHSLLHTHHVMYVDALENPTPSTPHENPTKYYFGCVLSDNQNVKFFTDYIDNVNHNNTPNLSFIHVPPGVTLYSASMLMNPNPIRTALQICNELITQQVYAIIVSHPQSGDLSPAAVSYTAGFYHIPVIGISSRDSAFSDKNIHVSFLRTVPPYSHQADVWVELLHSLEYKQVVMVQGSDTDGRTIMGRFQSLAHSLQDETNIKLEAVAEFESDSSDFNRHLEELMASPSRVILVYASRADAVRLFEAAAVHGMTGEGHVWIVTEQALDADNIPVGTLGLRLINANNEEYHIKDSLSVLVSALREMYSKEKISAAPQNCNNTGEAWETGDTFFRYIQKQILTNGLTGKVAFDENGDRINAEYEVINIDGDGRHKVVGKYAYSPILQRMNLELRESDIVWPGNVQKKPEGKYLPTHLQVVTIQEKPFVYTRRIEEDGACLEDEVPCPTGTNSTDDYGMYCCRGYCMDLLKALADTLQVIDFSKPFKYQGITILEKKQPKSSTLVSFLQPFRRTLWILVMVSVHVVALVLYLLDRFSPFGRFRLPNSDATEEDALNLSSAIWFSWGVLLNSGIGEGTPRSFSARVLGMLRNPMENFTYATVKGSAVDMYFRRQVELSNMYRTMEGNNFPSAEEAIMAVKSGQLNAFIWDSSRLEFEAAQDCDLVTAGELFGRSGYGIGLKKSSPWTDRVTLAILGFHEQGIMEDLDDKWIFQGMGYSCLEEEKAPATLGLKNMAGVFILVAAGIVGGVALIIIEIIYKKHSLRKQKRMELARHAADKWKSAVERRRNLRMAQEFQRGHHLKVNGVDRDRGPSVVSVLVEKPHI
ncbi:unnamed protein product [Cyprideis torosa]|uniref:Glutamate [NMDA] receptor subunit 1 n=1 Tax=Cyprideis torosa TaxID=163714 RepID=A0A7R8WBV0_9CRUS|nr:unnamed protein product [Cyprideis torosa]CAG0892692.1 unnamed protein product [Cyprideis torosa]